MKARVVGMTVLLAVCGLLPACGDDDGGGGGGPPPIGPGFPGPSALQNRVAADGAAFNDLSSIINKGLQVFWNKSNGHAIVAYLDALERLWVHYWNGATFTRAVQLIGPNQRIATHEDDSTYFNDLGDSSEGDDTFGGFGDLRVCFLNTAGNANANAAARDGDAVLFWSRQDEAPPTGASANEDANRRAYATYFDLSQVGLGVGVPASVQFGFNTAATTVDFDNQQDGLGNDDHVDAIGFVSDSLCGTHGFDRTHWENSREYAFQRWQETDEVSTPPATRSGDPTTHLFFLWIKGQGSGAVADPQNRAHYLEFDLTQPGNGIPSQTLLGQNTIDGTAGLPLDAAADIDTLLTVHNECLCWGGRSGAVRISYLSCFAPGAAPTTIELSDTGTFPGDAAVPRPCDVYGADHGGLASLYAFFPGAGSTQLFATKIDRDVALVQGTREIAAIDAGGGVDMPFQGTRINRNSDWIFAAWTENGTTSVCSTGLQTRKAGSARTLANSIPLGSPFAMANQANTLYAPPNAPAQISFQEEIACGTDCNPLCGIQSNANRLNFCWQEDNANVIELKTNGLTIALAAGDADQPAASLAFGAGTGLLAQTDADYMPIDSSDRGLNPTVTDLGNATGDALVYFVANANNPTDDTAPGAFDEARIFGTAAVAGVTPASAQIVSTNGTLVDNAYSDFRFGDESTSSLDYDDFTYAGGRLIRVATTPRSTVPGNHGGTTVHVFFVEQRAGPSSLTKLSTRYFDKTAFAAAGLLGPAHIPALGTPPFHLDGPQNDDARIPPTGVNNRRTSDGDHIGPYTAFATVGGTTVGIYFQSGRHFWYQEFTGTWRTTTGGESQPALIDDAFPAGLFFGRDQNAYAFPLCRLGQCDDLNGALVFYAKVLPGEDIGFRRWFARSHD